MTSSLNTCRPSMKLRNRVLWGVSVVVGGWLLLAFFVFSEKDVGLQKVAKSGGKMVKKALGGAAEQTVNDLMESPEHYHGEVKDGDTHDVRTLQVRHSNTEERSNKAVEANDSGSIQQSAPKIPGQRIIPTTPEMRQMVEWLGAQMDQVPKKPAREMGDQLLQVSDEYKDMPGKKNGSVASKKENEGNKLTLWEKFHLQIRRYELYPAASDLTERVMRHLAQEDIIDAVEKSGGTQLKVLFTLKDDAQALFKPKRFPREKADTLPDHFYFSDFERHFSEIGCYFLDRTLGFRRAPPVVGRKVNVSSDIKEYADKAFLKTFFWSPGKHLCFHGECSYYCQTGFSVCGDPYMLEGSMGLMLPPKEVAPMESIRHPWRRSYHKRKKAKWESNPNYCDIVKKQWDPKDRRLWDIMDLSVFDFLSGNLDRHHYVQYRDFGNDSSLIHLDQGRGFGKPYNDDLTCLQPIIHCCMIRRTTLVKLLKFYHGPVSLADQMKAAMARDFAAPILLDKHYNALDRRVPIILHEIAKCVKKKGLLNVVRDDGF